MGKPEKMMVEGKITSRLSTRTQGHLLIMQDHIFGSGEL